MICPVCRANNETTEQCRRCKVDLSELFALEKQRSVLIKSAQQCLAEKDYSKALSQAEKAHGLRRDGESQKLLAVCSLWNRDFARAWQLHRQYRESQKTT